MHVSPHVDKSPIIGRIIDQYDGDLKSHEFGVFFDTIHRPTAGKFSKKAPVEKSLI